MKKFRLFCLPFAGGSAMAYARWKAFLDDSIELVPIELAGRGSRIKAPLCETFDELVEDAYGQMQGQLDDLPYAIFGHSMGSWLAYELAHRIQGEATQPPVHLFFSARRAPQVEKPDPAFHTMPFDQLKAEMIKLGGSNLELFESKELLRVFLPILLADFKAMSTYRYEQRENALETAITVLSGKEDHEITTDDLRAWKRHSQIGCRINKMEGGHFFISEDPQKVVNIINQTLSG